MLEQRDTAQPMAMRRRLIIERRIQGELVLRISLYCVLSSIVTSMVHLIVGHPGNSQGQTIYLTGMLLVAVLVTIPLALHDAIKLSHRIVGPVYRLQRVIRRIARAESIAPVRVRDTDYWHDLVQDFNSMLLRINTSDTAPASFDKCNGASDELTLVGPTVGEGS